MCQLSSRRKHPVLLLPQQPSALQATFPCNAGPVEPAAQHQQVAVKGRTGPGRGRREGSHRATGVGCRYCISEDSWGVMSHLLTHRCTHTPTVPTIPDWTFWEAQLARCCGLGHPLLAFPGEMDLPLGSAAQECRLPAAGKRSLRQGKLPGSEPRLVCQDNRKSQVPCVGSRGQWEEGSSAWPL